MASYQTGTAYRSTADNTSDEEDEGEDEDDPRDPDHVYTEDEASDEIG